MSTGLRATVYMCERHDALVVEPLHGDYLHENRPTSCDGESPNCRLCLVGVAQCGDRGSCKDDGEATNHWCISSVTPTETEILGDWKDLRDTTSLPSVMCNLQGVDLRWARHHLEDLEKDACLCPLCETTSFTGSSGICFSCFKEAIEEDYM